MYLQDESGSESGYLDSGSPEALWLHTANTHQMYLLSLHTIGLGICTETACSFCFPADDRGEYVLLPAANVIQRGKQ